jgi:hypothetical protein
LNIDELVKLIQDHADGVEACKDQVVVFFIGNKGAGKSTTISWLLGRPPERVNCQILVQGKPMVDEMFRIRNPIPGLEDGKDQYQSVTKYIRAFPREDIGLTFCDAPGYRSETPEMEIANCVAITAALHAASSVRPVFVVTKKSIDDLRGENFQEVVQTISELIKTDFVHHVSSFSFLFTHCYDPSETHKNTNMPGLLQKAIQKNLNSLISRDLPNKSQQELILNRMLVELTTHGSFLVARPADESPGEFLKIVKDAKPIQDVKNTIQPALGPKHRTALDFSCNRLLQYLLDATHRHDFKALNIKLEQLDLLVKYTQMGVISDVYDQAVQEIIKSFRQAAAYANDSFGKQDFRNTRKFLDCLDRSIFKKLASQLRSFEAGSELANKPLDRLLLSINEFSQKTIESLQSLPPFGRDDFQQLGVSLDNLRDLCHPDVLRPYLLESRLNDYDNGRDVSHLRIRKYYDVAQNMINERVLSNEFPVKERGICTDNATAEMNQGIEAKISLQFCLDALKHVSQYDPNHTINPVIKPSSEKAPNVADSGVEGGQPKLTAAKALPDPSKHTVSIRNMIFSLIINRENLFSCGVIFPLGQRCCGGRRDE